MEKDIPCGRYTIVVNIASKTEVSFNFLFLLVRVEEWSFAQKT
jgi:hypothetical protein